MKNRLLKDHATLGLDRLYVRRDDQIIGLAYLVTLALRVMMDIEQQVRAGLAAEQVPLADYYPNQRTSLRPTTKTILERICFRGVTLVELEDNGEKRRYLSELPPILLQVLRYVQVSPHVYRQLIE